MRKLFVVLFVVALVVVAMPGCQPAPTPTPSPSTTPTPTPTPAQTSTGIPAPDSSVQMPRSLRMQGGASPGAGSDLMSGVVEEGLDMFFPDMTVKRFPMTTPDAIAGVSQNELDFCFWGPIQTLRQLWQGVRKGYEGEELRDMRLLGGCIPGLVVHTFYVPADTPYQTAADLLSKKPLRIGVGMAGTGSYQACEWAIETYGLTYEKIEADGGLVFAGGLGDTAAMLAEGKLDAMAFGLSHPSSVLQEMDLKTGVRCLPWSKEALEAVTGPPEHGLFPLTLPGGTYEGTPDDVTGIGWINGSYVNKDMPDEQAYNLAAAYFHSDMFQLEAERLPFMQGMEDTIISLNKDYTFPIPFHPGALKYWKERGITPNVEVID